MHKPWYESKTLWFNVFALLAVVVATLTQWPELADVAPSSPQPSPSST